MELKKEKKKRVIQEMETIDKLIHFVGGIGITFLALKLGVLLFN